jgi:aspartyl-tRNA synthetase
MYRTHEAGALRAEHVGTVVTLSGWIQAVRRFRKICFVELREASGLVQLVLSPEQAQGLTEESCLRVSGEVRLRSNPHPQLASYPTGQIEIQASECEVLGSAGTLPFGLMEAPAEEQMLRHRTLALRWPAHQQPLRARAAIVRAMRTVAETSGFLEVETPVLVRNTPGGAAPYLVPVEKHRGYALAQSPQVWKQLLVCGGIERYYQLAHCFRNEGARPERQPEFSQFEIEMAFGTAQSVMGVMEAMVQAAGAAVEVPLPSTFPRMTYLQALARFGSENPHRGNPLRLEGPEATPTTRFEHAQVRLRLPRMPEHQEEKAWLNQAWRVMGEHGEISMGGGVITATGPLEISQLALGGLLPVIGQAWGLIGKGVYPIWVEQFPLWERNEHGQWVSAHHPFTRPLPGHETRFGNPTHMLGEAFDLVINGLEIGGGSMRIHEAALQQQVFTHLGMPAAESQAHFRPLLEALALGAPPHGGMALGVERLASTLLGLPHIRMVMAFPKTTGGQCLLTEALS